MASVHVQSRWLHHAHVVQCVFSGVLPERAERVRIFAFEAVIGRVCRRMAFVLAHNLSLFVERASESPALSLQSQ
jgi:hypothetical protein